MISETDWLGGRYGVHCANPGGRPAKGIAAGSASSSATRAGFIAYATAGAVERAGGHPSCFCGGAMHWANERDRLAIEPAELLGDIGERRFRSLCRELGWQDLAEHYVPPHRDRQSGLGSGRCQWQGGYCIAIVSGQYCAEHEHTRYGGV